MLVSCLLLIGVNLLYLCLLRKLSTNLLLLPLTEAIYFIILNSSRKSSQLSGINTNLCINQLNAAIFCVSGLWDFACITASVIVGFL